MNNSKEVVPAIPEVPSELESKWIEGFEGMYSIREDGAVYSHSRITPKGRLRTGRFLKQQSLRAGYKNVHLSRDGDIYPKYTHRIVAKAFLDTYSEELTVDHIDMDKTNNHYTNMRMCTIEENRHFANQSGLPIGVSANGSGKWKARRGKLYLGTFATIAEAARAYQEAL